MIVASSGRMQPSSGRDHEPPCDSPAVRQPRRINGATHLSADETFRIGLEFLLDGIEARITS
jgi:hypothetical protein